MRSHLETLTSKLIECLHVDIDAQRKTLDLLESQRQAIQDEELAGVEQSTAQMVEQMRGMQERDLARRELVEAFARKLDLPTEKLTIGSLAQEVSARHGGAATQELLAARQELRDISAAVIRENRKLSALVGMRRRIVSDVIDSLLEEEGEEVRERDNGVLINAEA